MLLAMSSRGLSGTIEQMNVEYAVTRLADHDAAATR
jgi:hypothetical protein